MQIVGIVGYTIPFYGNRRCMPYGKIKILQNGIETLRPIKDAPDGTQYITVARKRYTVVNVGGLYSPVYKIKKEA